MICFTVFVVVTLSKKSGFGWKKGSGGDGWKKVMVENFWMGSGAQECMVLLEKKVVDVAISLTFTNLVNSLSSNLK